MIVVPLKGDTIETKDGVTFKVLSYTNYRDKGPAVYVEHTPSVPSDAVYFFDIIKINGKTVDYLTGPKVFKSTGEIKRKFHLPQPNDVVTFKAKEGNKVVKVSGLKLHKRDELAKGLLIMGEEDGNEEKLSVRINQIIDIERDIGNDLFSRDKFVSYYADYKGS